MTLFRRESGDGETGERSRWVYFQRQMLLDHPAMEIDPTVPPYKFVQWDGKVVRALRTHHRLLHVAGIGIQMPEHEVRPWNCVAVEGVAGQVPREQCNGRFGVTCPLHPLHG